MPRIAVALSRYNATVTDRLLEGAAYAFAQAGGRVGDLTIAEAAGAFELISVSAAAAASGGFDGVLALGCIIKGETRHDEYLAHAVTGGLAQLIIRTGVPVGLGVLTVNTNRQALDRSGGRLGNKGEEAMSALLHTIGQVRALGRAPGRAAPAPRSDGARRPDKLRARAARAPGARRGG